LVNLSACASLLMASLSLSELAIRAETMVATDPSGHIVTLAEVTNSGPTIVSQPLGRAVTPGRMTAFSVNVAGSSPLYFQWYFNNSTIPRATNDSLVIPAVSNGDFGGYFVIAANSSGSVTSIVAQLQVDADGDGLADAWEIANFGSITNQNASMDFDRDGNSNLTEFRDGTNPTNKTSLLPHLVLRPIGGQIVISPNNDHYTTGDSVSLTALPDPGLTFMSWAGDLSGSNPTTNLLMNADKFVQAVFGLPLNDMLGVTNIFTTGGDGGWFGQTNQSHDGISAAKTAPIVKGPNGSVSWMQTTVKLTKDGTVSFWWRSDLSDNFVEFLIDNNRVFNSTRELFNVTPWTFHTSYLSAGTHTINWTFHHAADGSSLDTGYTTIPEDAAYVDQLVITEYANPNLDSDGDGLPDLWEYKYFDMLNYGATDDPDADGVNNLTEYQDGTLPSSASSVDPRLTYVVEGNGTATSSPALAKFNYGQTVTNIGAPGNGWQFVAWRGPFLTQTSVTTKTNNPSTVQLLMSQTVRAIFGLPLAVVTDEPALVWTNGGELGWYGQTNVTLDGLSAARSGPVSSLGESWMETTVQGPGTLSFWWKVDSSTNLDQLSFLINGVTQPSLISGVVDWQQQSYFLGTGPQTLRWRFRRNGGADANRAEAAWVDQVQLSTGSTVPSFVIQPTNQSVLQVSNAVIMVLARGTPTISYQLFHGTIPYGQASSAATLTITNPDLSLTGTWSVQASNPAGVAQSDPFVLNVVAAPAQNDNFANRSTLPSSAVVIGQNFAATKEAGEPTYAGQSGGASVWWSWTAPQSGFYRAVAQATNSNEQLLLSVYTGTAVASLTPVGTTSSTFDYLTNGDSIATADDMFHATAASAYSIAVDTSFADGVWFGLWVEYLPSPANDLFANRTTLIGASASDASQLRTATAETSEPAHAGFPATNSVWWTWTAPATGPAIVDAVGKPAIPRVAVYTGATLAALQKVVAGFGGGTNSDTVLTFNATAGTAYQIAADSFFGAVGDIQLNVALKTPSIASPVVDDKGNLNLQVQAPAGTSFAIDASDDLKTWGTIYTGVVPASGTFDYQAIIPPGAKARFYRVRLN
jgi:List-Bact-rpt repeat protein/immunoglobulin I-set domain protein